MIKKWSITEVLSAILWVAGIIMSESRHMAFMILLSVSVHEAGHMCAFILLGEPIPHLRPGLFGLRLDPKRTMSYKSEFITAFAGPAANILCALIMILTAGLSDVAVINITLAVCNLLPAQTLDGGRMLECFTSRKMGADIAYTMCRAISFTVLSLVAMASLIAFWLTASGGYLFIQAFCAMVIHISLGQKSIRAVTDK